MFLRRLWNRATAPFQLMYWRMALPEAEGAKLLIECKGKFLMIREIYRQQHWTFPGGRMKRYETPDETARRKAKEEVGIVIDTARYLGSYFHTRQFKKDVICVYYTRVKSFDFKINSSSVAEAQWFTPEEMLQLERSESVDDAFELYRRHTGT